MGQHKYQYRNNKSPAWFSKGKNIGKQKSSEYKLLSYGSAYASVKQRIV